MPADSGSPSFTSTSGKTGLSEHPDSPTQSGYFTTVRCSCQRTSPTLKAVGVRFGHAGALVQQEEDSAAGVHVADIPSLVRG